MPVAEYFSPDYASARERFCAQAKRAGASLQAYELPHRRGPQDEPLTIDVARLGPATVDRALVVISGTHGVEGFAGSGCQVGFLSDRLHTALPPSACALLVHALNPHGFAWLRRVNEDGVDLNRNFVDFSQPLPASTQYERLHDSLVPTHWAGEERRAADAALQSMMTHGGVRAFQAALTAGQYTRPTGLFYGGSAPSWSARTLAEILSHLPADIRRVAVLDLHTGLGPAAYGEPTLIAHSAAERERARRWYGPEVRDLAADESVSAQIVGSVADGIAAALKDRDVTYMGLEFGTRPMLEVLTALRADHWLYAHGSAAEPSLRTSIQQQMRNAFYTDTPAWQAAVYGRVADFVFRACRGLAEQ
jgi:hypothetical protein